MVEHDLREPSAESVNKSRAHGGTMLKVLPLARQGLRSGEISEQTDLRYRVVVDCISRLRENGILPPSRHEFNKRLIERLKQPPDDPYERLRFLKMFNYDLYKRNREHFVSLSHVCKLAGSRNLVRYHEDEVITALRVMGVASTRFMVKYFRNGGKLASSYNVLLKEDESKAVSAIKRVFNHSCFTFAKILA